MSHNIVIVASAEEESSGKNGLNSVLKSLPELECAIVGEPTLMQLATAEKIARDEKLLLLKQSFINGLKAKIPDIGFNYSDDLTSLSHIISLRLPTFLPLATLLFKLDLAGLSISAGAACSAGALQSSAVTRFLNLEKGYQTLRVSLSHHNNLQELQQAIDIIHKNY